MPTFVRLRLPKFEEAIINRKFSLAPGLISLLFIATIFANEARSAEKLVYSYGGTFLGGICSKIMAAAHDRVGIEMTISSFPAKRALKSSNSGLTDGEICRIAGLESKFPNLVRIDPSYISMTASAFSTNHSIKVEDWHSLSNYQIGIHRGHLYAENATRGMHVTTLNSDKHIIQMLLRGRVDVGVLADWAALKAIKEIGVGDEIKKLKAPLIDIPLYLYLHKKNKNYASVLGESIQEVIDDGTAKRIIEAELLPYK